MQQRHAEKGEEDEERQSKLRECERAVFSHYYCLKNILAP